MVQIDGSKKRVKINIELDGSKYMGSNTQVQIDGFKKTGPKRWFQKIDSNTQI